MGSSSYFKYKLQAFLYYYVSAQTLMQKDYMCSFTLCHFIPISAVYHFFFGCKRMKLVDFIFDSSLFRLPLSSELLPPPLVLFIIIIGSYN